MLFCYWCCNTLDIFVEHISGQPGENFILPLVSETWLFYRTHLGLLFCTFAKISAGIPFCWTWLNYFEINIFTYTTKRFLNLSYESGFIFYNSMRTIHLCCCNNACLLISEKISYYLNSIFDSCNSNHIYKYFFLYTLNWYDFPQVFQRPKFQWWGE